jgi:hypothetical protein
VSGPAPLCVWATAWPPCSTRARRTRSGWRGKRVQPVAPLVPASLGAGRWPDPGRGRDQRVGTTRLRDFFPSTTASSGWTCLAQHGLPMAAPLGDGEGSRLERHRPLPKGGDTGQPPAGGSRENKTARILLTHHTDRRLVRPGDPAQLQAAARRCHGVNDGATRAAESERTVLGIQLRWPARCPMANVCIPGTTAPSHSPEPPTRHPAQQQH